MRAIWAFRIDSELRLLFEWSLLKPSHPVAGLFFMCIGQEEKRTRLLAHRFMRAFVLLRLSVGSLFLRLSRAASKVLGRYDRWTVSTESFRKTLQGRHESGALASPSASVQLPFARAERRAQFKCVLTKLGFDFSSLHCL